MNGFKKLAKATNSPIYFLDEEITLNQDHLKQIKDHLISHTDLDKVRLLLNPNFHDAQQESIFFANKNALFTQKRFPFLPWMECELLEGSLSLIQYFAQGEELSFLSSQSPKVRFDPAVYHSFKITSEVAIFKVKSIGPYLEKLVEKKVG